MAERGEAPPTGLADDDGAPALGLVHAVLLVAVGGVLGALVRFGLTEALPGPWHTLLANLPGCLLLGLLVGARPDDAVLRAFAGTGVLGGLTTMSTFAVETDRLDLPAAVAYVVVSVAGGLLLAAVGLQLGLRLGLRVGRRLR